MLAEKRYGQASYKFVKVILSLFFKPVGHLNIFSWVSMLIPSWVFTRLANQIIDQPGLNGASSFLLSGPVLKDLSVSAIYSDVGHSANSHELDILGEHLNICIRITTALYISNKMCGKVSIL